MRLKAVRGTRDIVPEEFAKWRYVEDTARRVFRLYGYDEIRTPTFEQTELFIKGTGETTDIVEKEMYTFIDKGNRSITLRPEGTPQIVRAYLEHGMSNTLPVVKLSYIGQMFRYERPQAGRYREFWQMGAEAFGTDNPAIDAELIEMAYRIVSESGLTDFRVEINSIGCRECRPAYVESLKEFAAGHIDELCGKCRDRLNRNPLRIIDCKEETCAAVITDAPMMIDNLCRECSDHLSTLRSHLDRLGVPYAVNPRIVRGLDYYTKTVFELIASGLGAQNAVGGGGRYDYLVELMGGNPTPGLGFGLGLDRIVDALNAQQFQFPVERGIDCFLATLDADAMPEMITLASRLRSAGFSVEMEFRARSLRAQMKTADKMNAKFVVIVGGDEMADDKVTLREMQTGRQDVVALNDLVSAIEKKTR